MEEEFCDSLPVFGEGVAFLATGLGFVDGEEVGLDEDLGEPVERGLEIVVFVDGVLAVAGRGEHAAGRDVIISALEEIY